MEQIEGLAIVEKTFGSEQWKGLVGVGGANRLGMNMNGFEVYTHDHIYYVLFHTFLLLFIHIAIKSIHGT